MALEKYRRKRDFEVTAEPGPRVGRSGGALIFVIQQHAARRLHWDFRLEFEGVLKSWAVTREPVMDPRIKRLAIQTEDHPLAYAQFHGEIPKGQYGGGHVDIWDHGHFEPIGDFGRGLRTGKVEFTLHGRKLTGKFALIRTNFGKPGKESWLLIKMKEEGASKSVHRRGAEKRTTWPRPAAQS